MPPIATRADTFLGTSELAAAKCGERDVADNFALTARREPYYAPSITDEVAAGRHDAKVTDMRIANQLLRALDAGQMTPRDLVDLTGLSMAEIQRLARTDWNPPLGVAARVAWAVGMPIGKLFWLEPRLERP